MNNFSSKLQRGLGSLLNNNADPNQPAIPKKNSFVSLNEVPLSVQDEQVAVIIPTVSEGVTIDFKTSADIGRFMATDGPDHKGGRRTYLGLPELIKEEPGQNIRYEFGDIAEQAQSMREGGQYEPLEVFAKRVGGVWVFYIIEGHRRMLSVAYNLERGYDVPYVEFFISEEPTREERLWKMIVSQNKKHLEPLEAAAALRELYDLGWTNEKIAAQLGKSEVYVRDMIILDKEDPQIKQLIKDKRITYTAVVEMNRVEPNPLIRKDAIMKKVMDEGKFTVADAKAEKNRKKRTAKGESAINEVEGIALFGDVIWYLTKLTEKFKNGTMTATEIQMELTILQEEGKNPVEIMRRLQRLEENESKYFGEFEQEQFQIIINYIRGTADPGELLKIGG
jgi:ParB-like chromosome segregation protein Spo0J